MLFGGSTDGNKCSSLLDSGATANFIRQAVVDRLKSIVTPTEASLELADGNSLPILGRVQVTLKMGASHCHMYCYVTKLAESFDLILGNTFLVDHRVVMHFGTRLCTVTWHGKAYNLTPKRFAFQANSEQDLTADVEFNIAAELKSAYAAASS